MRGGLGPGNDPPENVIQGNFGGGGGKGPMDHKEYTNIMVDSVKAQNDARFAEVLQGIKNLDASISATSAALSIEMSLARQSADEAKAAAASMKWNIIATAIAVVSVLFAAWSLWAQGIEMITSLIDSPSVDIQSEPPGDTLN